MKEICKHCTGRYCTKKISIFGILDKEQQALINELILHREYKKGHIIFYEGDICDQFYLITKGKIKITKYTKDGHEQLLYVVSEGDYLGDLSILKKGICSNSAEALEDTSVCILRKDDLDLLLKKHPALSLKIMEIFHDRIATLESLLHTLGNKEVETRLAGLLISFIKDFGTPTNQGIVLDIPLSREDLANHIGTSRETVSRKLSVMQDEGIIELMGYKKILIRDIAQLENYYS